jgi:hypothetical protein
VEVLLYSAVGESTENARSNGVGGGEGVKDVKLGSAGDEGARGGAVDAEEESRRFNGDLLSWVEGGKRGVVGPRSGCAPTALQLAEDGRRAPRIDERGRCTFGVDLEFGGRDGDKEDGVGEGS